MRLKWEDKKTYIYIYIFVCVCVRKRERESESDREIEQNGFILVDIDTEKWPAYINAFFIIPVFFVFVFSLTLLRK